MRSPSDGMCIIDLRISCQEFECSVDISLRIPKFLFLFFQLSYSFDRIILSINAVEMVEGYVIDLRPLFYDVPVYVGCRRIPNLGC